MPPRRAEPSPVIVRSTCRSETKIAAGRHLTDVAGTSATAKHAIAMLSPSTITIEPKSSEPPPPDFEWKTLGAPTAPAVVNTVTVGSVAVVVWRGLLFDDRLLVPHLLLRLHVCVHGRPRRARARNDRSGRRRVIHGRRSHRAGGGVRNGLRFGVGFGFGGAGSGAGSVGVGTVVGGGSSANAEGTARPNVSPAAAHNNTALNAKARRRREHVLPPRQNQTPTDLENCRS